MSGDRDPHVPSESSNPGGDDRGSSVGTNPRSASIRTLSIPSNAAVAVPRARGHGNVRNQIVTMKASALQIDVLRRRERSGRYIQRLDPARARTRTRPALAPGQAPTACSRWSRQFMSSSAVVVPSSSAGPLPRGHQRRHNQIFLSVTGARGQESRMRSSTPPASFGGRRRSTAAGLALAQMDFAHGMAEIDRTGRSTATRPSRRERLGPPATAAAA